MYLEAEETGLTFVGAPMEVVRTTDTKYLDQARSQLPDYVAKTLAANMVYGGRYDPPGVFGAIYCASDEDTAWDEIAARCRREGIPGIPPVMGLLRLLIKDGQYADLTDDDTVALWEFESESLVADDPTDAQKAHCHHAGMSVRPVADLLLAPSARGGGQN